MSVFISDRLNSALHFVSRNNDGNMEIVQMLFLQLKAVLFP